MQQLCVQPNMKKRPTAKMQNPPQTPTLTLPFIRVLHHCPSLVVVATVAVAVAVVVVWWPVWSSCGAPQRLKWFASHFFTSLIAY